jgi:hypothetical protein
MADTSYGRFLATQKRDAERAFQHMSPAEREAFLRRLMEINAANANDGQSPPTNPTPVWLTSNYHYILIFSSILHVLVQLFWRRLQPNAIVKNVRISWPPEMSSMIATEGELDRTAAHTKSQQCVEGAGAGVRASNDQKPTIRGVVG